MPSHAGTALAALGRLCLSAIFFVSGFRKLEDPAAIANRISEVVAKAAWAPEALAVGVRQAAPLLAWSAIGIEFLGAFCLVTGFKKEFGAALLVGVPVFLIRPSWRRLGVAAAAALAAGVVIGLLVRWNVNG